MLTIAKLHSESVAYYESTVDDPEKAVAASGSEATAGDTAAGPDGYYSEDGTAPATAWINGVDAKNSVALAEFLGVVSGEQCDGAAVRGWFNRMCAPSGAKLGRKPGPTTLPGYDLTFCAPKSVSVLWGLTNNPAVRSAVDAAHAAAVSAAMQYVTAHAAYTRRRVDADTVLVERTLGLSGVTYEHRTARSGDPHVHSHVLLSNRQLCADGKVLSLDGVNVYHEARAGGMIYQATLRAELSDALGLTWGEMVNGCADIAGLDDPEMLEVFSTRTRELDQWRDANGVGASGGVVDDAVEAAAGKSGASGSSAALTSIAQKKTRQTKDLQTSLVEHEAQWQVQLRGVGQAGQVREFIARLDPTSTGTGADRPAECDGVSAVLGGGYPSVDEVLAAVSAQRSTFTRADLVEETAALVAPGVAADQVQASVERIVDEAIVSTSAWSVTPDQARSFDRSKREGSQRFTTSVVVAEVDRGIDLATAPTVAQVSTQKARAMIHPVAGVLSVQQADAMVAVVSSGYCASVVVAPAGSGKTSSLKAARAVWSAVGCQVVGLAPTGKAADVMTGEDVADTSSTIARVLRQVDGLDPVAAAGVLGWDRDTVVVVDEAGMVATPEVVRLLEVATAAGARVVLVGDPHQYAAVKARSGMLATLAYELPDAVELSEVFRQQDPAERAASRGLRDGDELAVGRAANWYAEHDRLAAGSVSAMLTDALEAWHTDMRAGWESLLVADSNDTVDALNVAAQQRLIVDGVIEPTGACVTVGSRSGFVGDVVLTCRNDYCLVSSAGEPVRNGQRWKITAIGEDGSAQLRRLDGVGASGGGDADAAVTVTVPAEYLGRHTRLGYASTGHGCQGVTVDAARVVVEAGRADRAGVYVPLTRGRKVNALYLAETSPGDSETGHDRAATVDTAGSGGRRESVEYARDLLVAACSRERADVTPHAVWGTNWDRWSMERLSTDLAVGVHPFTGTPMAEAMEHRRQLREARWDIYAARQAAGSGVTGPEVPVKVSEDTPVMVEKPQAQVPAPRPDAQRPLREVDDRLLRLAGESWGLRLKVKQASEPLEQEATALRKVEQAARELTAAQEKVERCAGLLQVAESKFRDAEQAAGRGIGWLKSAGRKKAERHGLHTAQRKVAQARQETAVAQQDVERAARWLAVVQHQAARVQLTPQQRQACQEQLALYRRLEDTDEVRRELLDRKREQAQAAADSAVGRALPATEDIEVVFAEYTDPSGPATGSIFGYSITEQLRAAKANQYHSSGTGQSSGPSSAPGVDRDIDGPSL